MTIAGVWALHKAGFVHRDISTGNILAYRVGENIYAKIGDLEYMRKLEDLTLYGDIKTVRVIYSNNYYVNFNLQQGTLQFISVELQRRCYQFWQDKCSIVQAQNPDYQQIVQKRQRDDFENLSLGPEGATKASETK